MSPARLVAEPASYERITLWVGALGCVVSRVRIAHGKIAIALTLPGFKIPMLSAQLTTGLLH